MRHKSTTIIKNTAPPTAAPIAIAKVRLEGLLVVLVLVGMLGLVVVSMMLALLEAEEVEITTFVSVVATTTVDTIGEVVWAWSAASATV